MRNVFLGSILFLSIAAPAQLSAADPVLWYQHPAQKWGDALPIGNGRLGGMVFGGIAKERIQLNEAGSADHRFCGPHLFGPVMERSNSCARIGGHSHPVDDQTAAFVLFLRPHAGVFVVA